MTQGMIFSVNKETLCLEPPNNTQPMVVIWQNSQFWRQFPTSAQALAEAFSKLPGVGKQTSEQAVTL